MKKKTKKLKGIKYPKSDEVRYRKLLLNFIKSIKEFSKKELYDYFDYIATHDINSDKLNKKFRHIDKYSNKLLIKYFPYVKNILKGINKKNSKKVSEMVKSSLSIDLKSVLETDNIKKTFKSIVDQNLSLIKTLSDKQINELKIKVLNKINSGIFNAADLKNVLINQFNMSDRHATMIARDQSAKLTSSLNALRYQKLGSKKYQWKNSQDNRVRGNPSGLYPKAKPSHWKREDKIYYWDKPPAGGHPGMDYQCRCIAKPIFEAE